MLGRICIQRLYLPMIPSHYYPVRQGGTVVPYWFGLRFRY